jgi:DNA-binding winged helix-turn-helix (wHTH) protein
VTQGATAWARRERRAQFVFGECVLGTGRRELSRGLGLVAVGPQVFDVLIHLIENGARVVSKDELFDVIWRGRTVSESTLTSHVKFARRAIGVTGEEQRLIRTIPRKGFRFVGDVREAPPASAATSSLAETAPSDTVETSLGALALPDQPSVAVLPFLNLSGDQIRIILSTAWSRTPSERCRACNGCSSSRAIRASLTKAALLM